MKAVMISIQPKWCKLIVNGQKTIEVRKTRPKIDIPFKGYIYMTQGTYKDLGTYCDWIYENRMKVIGEFVCDKIDEYTNYSISIQDGWEKRREDILKASCLSIEEWTNYVGDCISDFGYCIHISDLKIYDKPKELGEFYKSCDIGDKVICSNCEQRFNRFCNGRKYIKRPPQSWCYVEEL